MYGKGKVIALSERTLKEFNINITTLVTGSHHKVYVRCVRCGEEFTREWRYLHQLHNCPTYKTREDGTLLKWCNHCKQFITTTMFNVNLARYDKLSSYCKSCSNQCVHNQKQNERKQNERKTNFNSWIKNYLCTKKSRCKKDRILCELDIESLTRKWNQQCGRCFYTGISLEFATKGLRGAQLDRIDPNGGYILDNVVWASRAINQAKSNATVGDFLNFCLEVNLTNFLNVNARLECKLCHPDAKIPYRKRPTDAGYDIVAINGGTILPNRMLNIHTGVILTCPSGYYITIEPRSSLWMKGISPFHGIIDATYTGELMVCLMNYGSEPYVIEKGNRIAQLILHKNIPFDIVEVSSFSPDYNERGTAGFGESGV